MSRKTDNINLNIEYRSPERLINTRLGYDENCEIIDSIYPMILDALDQVSEKYSEIIELDDEE